MQAALVKAVYRAGTLQLLDPVNLPEGAEVWVQLQPAHEGDSPLVTYPTRPQPPESLSKLVDWISVGGDALADTEALYKG